MKFFDRVNLIGRVLVGGFITYLGINYFLNPIFGFSSVAIERLVYFLAFWKIIGGIALALGIKPRATAAILIIVFLINIIIDAFGFSAFSPSLLFKVMIDKISILGALLFIAGTRSIPYGLMIRSEDSMNEKYGGEISE